MIKQKCPICWLGAIIILTTINVSPFSHAASCTVGDTSVGVWVNVTDKYGKCTPPTTMYQPEMKLAGTAYGGSFKVSYTVQYTNIAGCGLYGAWGPCDRGCSDTSFVCPIGNEIATGTMAYNCQGTCGPSPYGTAVKNYQGGCCVFVVETYDKCSYQGRSQYMRKVEEWVCDDCRDEYNILSEQCGDARVINWDNETCTGECDPCSIEQYNAMAEKCGGSQNIIRITGACDALCFGEENFGPPNSCEPKSKNQ